MIKNKKTQVEAMKFGTVIDHIPTKIGFKLVTLFNLTATDYPITIGLNLPSNTLGRKDLIKIENTILTTKQTNQLAIYTPYATVNYINNYIVVRKLTLSLKNNINDILICSNSNCISRSEPVVFSLSIESYNRNTAIQCRYCERDFIHQISP